MEQIFCFLGFYLSSKSLILTLNKVMKLERSRHTSASVRRDCSQAPLHLALLIKSCFNHSVLQMSTQCPYFLPHTGHILHSSEGMLCPKCKTLMSFCSLFDPFFSFTLSETAQLQTLTEVQEKKLCENLSDVILHFPQHFADIFLVTMFIIYVKL